MSGRKKEIIVVSNNGSDIQAATDTLRAMGFDPKAMEDPEELIFAEDVLEIKWEPDHLSARILWQHKGKNYTKDIRVEERAFAEPEENRRRRVLRLGLCNLCRSHPEMEISVGPWGVLNGVRPNKVTHRFLDEGLKDEEIRKAFISDFGLEEEKADLLVHTANFQRRYLPKAEDKNKPISIYLGYPFCPSRCSYCSFPGYDLTKFAKLKAPVIEAMGEEIRSVGRATKEMGLKVETIYFGGGTPTAMSCSEMEFLLSALQTSFAFTKDPEWTIEGGRPDTLTEEMLRSLEKFPVNRICVNPQSMSQKTLDKIGRKHTAEDIEDTFTLIRKISEEDHLNWSINSDIIIGLPDETEEDVKHTLEFLKKVQPENITCHHLAMKRASRLNQEGVDMPQIRLVKEMGELVKITMKEMGYIPYYLYRQKEIAAGGENIGYTKPGYECKYNILMIEERQTILGLGVGSATKYLKPGTFELINEYNPKDIHMYMDRLSENILRKVENLKAIC